MSTLRTGRARRQTESPESACSTGRSGCWTCSPTARARCAGWPTPAGCPARPPTGCWSRSRRTGLVARDATGAFGLGPRLTELAVRAGPGAGPGRRGRPGAGPAARGHRRERPALRPLRRPPPVRGRPRRRHRACATASRSARCSPSTSAPAARSCWPGPPTPSISRPPRRPRPIGRPRAQGRGPVARSRGRAARGLGRRGRRGAEWRGAWPGRAAARRSVGR